MKFWGFDWPYAEWPTTVVVGKKKSWIMTAWPVVDCNCSDSGCHVVVGTLESFTAVEEAFPIAAPKLVCYNMKIAGDIVTQWHSLQPHPFCFLRVFLKHLTTIHTLLLHILTYSNLFWHAPSSICLNAFGPQLNCLFFTCPLFPLSASQLHTSAAICLEANKYKWRMEPLACQCGWHSQ